jgi:hypothetical protein
MLPASYAYRRVLSLCCPGNHTKGITH